MCSVSSSDISAVSDYAEEEDPPVSLEFLRLARILMMEQSLKMPKSIEEAIDLHITLVDLKFYNECSPYNYY